ncbi:MAG: hypothetical protein JSR45_17860 [Proteobacteria bacterium]|nr:hypothetical protein [Pseudomonadota bacterium]
MSKAKVTRQATVSRAMIGLGAVAVGASVLLSGTILALVRLVPAGANPFAGRPWWIWLTLLATYAVVFLMIEALALPVWWALDRRGVRQWWVAALVGGLGGGGAATALMAWSLYRKSIAMPPGGMTWLLGAPALISAVAGAVMGLVVWRIAYRRVPDAAEAF